MNEETPILLPPDHKHYHFTVRYAYGKRLRRNAHRRRMSVQQKRAAKNKRR